MTFGSEQEVHMVARQEVYKLAFPRGLKSPRGPGSFSGTLSCKSSLGDACFVPAGHLCLLLGSASLPLIDHSATSHVNLAHRWKE